MTLPDQLKTLYPFTPKEFITPRGAAMSYLDEGGQGTEAVLMLHGNPTWSFYFRELVKTVSPKLRCIAPDHIGMGLSAKPQLYSYTLETRIKDLIALVESLGLTKIHLVVHDWGGAIGFGLATRMPELIGRIVILNTAAYPSKHLPKRINLCKTGPVGTFLVRGLNGFAGPALWMSMHRRSLTKDEKAAMIFPYNSWENRVAVDAFVKDIPMTPDHPTMPVLQTISNGLAQFANNPIFIVWGGKDFCFNDHFYLEWKNRYPKARALYVKDGGHYILEDARDEVVPQITDFLLG